MKIPMAYEDIVCPNCKRKGAISFVNSHFYWLAESEWKCPYCKKIVTTEELQDEQPEEIYQS